ncbi:MAG TPA: MBL fold metallo-hydrolase [Pseudonocardiaceae bacterium]|nr:MBL fold metallo-hydrolase [Pseudonocardiaceae bacterium]
MAGNLDVRWHAGVAPGNLDPDPPIQVHAYRPDTIILRQNKSVHYEAPFLFLLFGTDIALLLDTGATADPALFPLRATVDGLIDDWLITHPKPGYRLLVAHTHSHDDHIAADGQFADRAATTVVGTRLADVITYYGLLDWPAGRAEIDLGGRIVDVLPGPGHQVAATVFYDRATHIMFAGDSLLRGRLYVFDWPAYAATVRNLVAFGADSPVSHVLGCHIEMSRTAGEDYPLGSTYQPDEAPLELSASHLDELNNAVHQVDNRPGVHPFDDFIIYNFQPR